MARAQFFSFLAAFLTLSCVPLASAQTSPFTENLSLGSRGPQVVALQKFLNQDIDTRVAETGPGSTGNETNYFGPLTKVAAIRFQEKYTGDILTPVELTRGNGYVGPYTRAKLNSLSVSEPVQTSSVVPAPAGPVSSGASLADYVVKNNEKIDIYLGDKLIANTQKRIDAAINTGIASRVSSRSTSTSTAPIVLPTIGPGDTPSIAIGAPSPQSGPPGTHLSIKGRGISENSIVYFGNDYIVRKITKGLFEDFTFTVPPIPPGRYDIAIRTGGAVSNTTMFVVTDANAPPVHIESLSLATIPYGGTLTIIGSGFSPRNNVVITTYQKFTNVSSPDGKTLTITLAPGSLDEYSKVSNGTVKIPMSLHVVNDHGFSDSEKSFTMAI